MVFDFSVGERGLFDHRPEHRLGRAIKISGQEKLAHFADDLRFGGVAHRCVGALPVPEDAQTAKLLGLYLDPALREGAAFLAEGNRVNGLFVLTSGAVVFLDLPFDWQAVAIPAGHIDRIIALHLTAAVDDVFEDLVLRMADVQIPVGVGRPIVQHELRPSS